MGLLTNQILIVSHDGRHDALVPVDTYKIVVQFPEKAHSIIDELTPDLTSLLPNPDKKMCRLDVSIPPGSYSFVTGYGMPFSHPGKEFEAFMTQNAPDNLGITLVDILQRQNFTFLVGYGSRAFENQWMQPLPPPPRYPYGEEHFWSLERYDDILPKNKGHRFPPAWSFDNDNEHLAALSHSQAQDIMWIHNAAEAISQLRFRAYFVGSGDEDPQTARELHVIVPLGPEFLAQYEQPWRRLTESGSMKLCLYEDEDDEAPAEWKARIEIVFSDDMHPVTEVDLVLQVRRPPPTSTEKPDFAVRSFTGRVGANNALRQDRDNWTCVSLLFEDLLHDYERKVDGVNALRPGVQPSNAVALGVPKKVVDLARVQRPVVRPDIKFRMDLHRALVRNNGFFEVLVPKKDDEEVDDLGAAMAKAKLEDDDEPRVRSLPDVNFLNFAKAKIDALLEEALPGDRQRLRAHLSKVILGFVLVTAVSNLLFTFLPSSCFKLQ